MKRIAFLLALIMILTLPLATFAEDEIIIQNNTVEDDNLIIDTDTILELDDTIIIDDGDLTLDLDLTLSDDLIDIFSSEPIPQSPELSKENASPSRITIGVKETYKFNASKLGSGLTYVSSKPEIATVNSKGVITGKKAGKSTVTAKNKKVILV